MRAEMTPEQRELIEEFGLLHEQMGGTRMTGRVSAWLLLCDPPLQSLTEIAEGLGVSKAAVSGAARLLLQSRLVERVSEPGHRGDYYRALPADPDGILPLDHVHTLHRLIPARPGDGRRPRPVAAQLLADARPARVHGVPGGRAAAAARPLARAPCGRVTDFHRRTWRSIAPDHWRHHLSWLTKMSLRNRSIVGLAVLAVLLVGAYAITSLKQELIPDLTFPYLTVLTVDQGSSPKDVERNITTPLEQAIKTSSGVKEFDSFSNDGMSIITIEYEFGTDMKAKEAEVQQSVSGVQQMLPATAMAPEVATLNFGSMPVVQLAVTSSLPAEQLATLLGTRVVPRLQSIEGVQAVTLAGVQQMQLNIELKPEQVAALGVTPTQIMTAITQANVTTGAGSVTSGSIVYPITVSAKAETGSKRSNSWCCPPRAPQRPPPVPLPAQPASRPRLTRYSRRGRRLRRGAGRRGRPPRRRRRRQHRARAAHRRHADQR